MNDPRFNKLPEWAKDYIRKIEQERETAVRELREANERIAYLDEKAELKRLYP